MRARVRCRRTHGVLAAEPHCELSGSTTRCDPGNHAFAACGGRPRQAAPRSRRVVSAATGGSIGRPASGLVHANVGRLWREVRSSTSAYGEAYQVAATSSGVIATTHHWPLTQPAITSSTATTNAASWPRSTISRQVCSTRSSWASAAFQMLRASSTWSARPGSTPAADTAGHGPGAGEHPLGPVSITTERPRAAWPVISVSTSVSRRAFCIRSARAGGSPSAVGSRPGSRCGARCAPESRMVVTDLDRHGRLAVDQQRDRGDVGVAVENHAAARHQSEVHQVLDQLRVAHVVHRPGHLAVLHRLPLVPGHGERPPEAQDMNSGHPLRDGFEDLVRSGLVTHNRSWSPLVSRTSKKPELPSVYQIESRPTSHAGWDIA